MSIADNIKQILGNIEAARLRSPRAAKQVHLLAVSKTKPIEAVTEAWNSGQKWFGENRVQELVPKQEALPDAEWHLIGHLQTNKVKYIIGKTALIHSLDNIGLADEIEKRSAAAGLITDCLVQVNIAEEEQKSGLYVPELASFIDAMADRPHIKIKGLMTIGPVVEDPEDIRPVFSELRRLFEREKARDLPFADFQWLSRGMSHDYHIAVEEGANIVRVGSSIFGARQYN
ncbi:MAG: YggS family pyridoxal phosphate-dependent enzyme [Phoenicibacter congonensis]|uniref:Pyridoxal phosphate homeostasis protein n=1 Tax=Phoenicibacter congonensis TaxID=1944646 RepID=A0AA43UBG6_9ACTN|nr:YggS family pyridoxal phosphate-dependent enzyme [Phoenicibacter congonensis]